MAGGYNCSGNLMVMEINFLKENKDLVRI